MSHRSKPPKPVKGITFAEISRRLGVTLISLYTWRAGSSQRVPLPVTVHEYGQHHRISVAEQDLITWLTAYRPDLLAVWQGATK